MFTKSNSFRRAFAARWANFLRENYRSPEVVAKAFNCTQATARLWLDGEHIPLGHAVAIGFAEHPDSAKEHLTNMEQERQWSQGAHVF